MKFTSCAIALSLLHSAPMPANADSRIAKFCGPHHANEVASDTDVRSNPAGFYVTSLREQISAGDARIILSPQDDFYLCTRTAATPDMDTSKALVLMHERMVKYLFVPIIRRDTGSSS